MVTRHGINLWALMHQPSLVIVVRNQPPFEVFADKKQRIEILDQGW
jgi:hypothetical protein